MTAIKPGAVPEVEQHDAELEARVAVRTEELSALSTHLLKMMEGERSQLAKELHDELGGLITAAKMDMAWLQAHIGGALDPPSKEKFASVVQMLNQAMTLKRRVVESLRPSLLDHFGLPVALRSHFDENCGRAGIEYVATLPEEILDLDPAVQLTLFRVAQESLTNLLARGQAKHVELVIECQDEPAGGQGYLLTVGDDGTAMSEAQLRALVGMRHRVMGAGGRMDAQAAPGLGNRITVFVPKQAASA